MDSTIRLHLTRDFNYDLSFDELVKRFRRLPDDGLSLLESFAFAATDIPRLQFHQESAVTPLSLGLLMATTLAAKDIASPEIGDNVRTKRVPTPLLTALCELAYSIRDELPAECSASPSERGLRNLARFFNLSALLQSTKLYEIARAAIVSGLVSVNSLPDLSNDSTLANFVQDQWGDDLLNAVSVPFYLWVPVSTNPYIYLPRFVQDFRQKTEALSRLRLYFNQRSLSPQQARDYLNGELSRYPDLSKAFLLFSRFPFIRLGDDHFLAAPHQFVIQSASSSLMGMIYSSSKKSAYPAKGSVKNVVPLHALARRFEVYAYHVLKAAMPDTISYQEHPYSNARKELLSPDGIFVGRGGKDCLLLQAKQRFPLEGLLYNYFDGAFDKMLRDSYAESVVQSIKYLYTIEHMRSSEFSSVGLEVATNALAARRWYLLSVFPDAPGFSHLLGVQDMIESFILDSLAADTTRPELAQWYIERRRAGQLALWHVDHIETFELFASCRITEFLPFILRRWKRDLPFRFRMMVNNASAGVPASFRDSIYQTWGGRNGAPLPFLDEAFRLLEPLLQKEMKLHDLTPESQPS